MSLVFNTADIFTDQYKVSKDQRLGGENTRGDIPNSDQISGIELRLSRVLIKENGNRQVWPFPRLAKLYLVVIVVSDDPDNPVQNLSLRDFPKVGNDEELPIDRCIFYWKKTDSQPSNPGQIHALVSVIKSREGLRNSGEVLKRIKSDDQYQRVIGDLTELANLTNPATVAIDALLGIATIVGSFLGKIEDRPLITWVQSFTDINGDLDMLGKKPFSRSNDRVDLRVDLVVRDKDRERTALTDSTQLSDQEKEVLGLDEH